MSSSKGESVFDRLHRSSTASSRSKTSTGSSRRLTNPPATAKPSVNATPSSSRRSYPTQEISSPSSARRKPHSTSGGSALDRLCRPTASSLSKTSSTSSTPTSPQKSPFRISASGTPKKDPSASKQLFPETPPNSARHPATEEAKEAPKVEEIVSALDAVKVEENVTADPSSLEWSLTYTSKYDKNDPKQVETLSPGSLKLTNAFQDFELGLADERHLAVQIIEALFQRDFLPGEHWDIDSATVSETDEGFAAEKIATWNKGDIYSEASAKGLICFRKDTHEIRVENYSYYVAG